MKSGTAAALLLVVGACSSAVAGDEAKKESYPSTRVLNKSLLPLYESVVAGKPEAEIVGRTLDLSLTLRFSSEKHILFEDTRIIVDETTRYEFIKWEFDPAATAATVGKTGVQCRVTGKVERVERGAATPGMPYLIARLESIAIQPATQKP